MTEIDKLAAKFKELENYLGDPTSMLTQEEISSKENLKTSLRKDFTTLLKDQNISFDNIKKYLHLRNYNIFLLAAIDADRSDIIKGIFNEPMKLSKIGLDTYKALFDHNEGIIIEALKNLDSSEAALIDSLVYYTTEIKHLEATILLLNKKFNTDSFTGKTMEEVLSFVTKDEHGIFSLSNISKTASSDLSKYEDIRDILKDIIETNSQNSKDLISVDKSKLDKIEIYIKNNGLNSELLTLITQIPQIKIYSLLEKTDRLVDLGRILKTAIEHGYHYEYIIDIYINNDNFSISDLGLDKLDESTLFNLLKGLEGGKYSDLNQERRQFLVDFLKEKTEKNPELNTSPSNSSNSTSKSDSSSNETTFIISPTTTSIFKTKVTSEEINDILKKPEEEIRKEANKLQAFMESEGCHTTTGVSPKDFIEAIIKYCNEDFIFEYKNNLNHTILYYVVAYSSIDTVRKFFEITENKYANKLEEYLKIETSTFPNVTALGEAILRKNREIAECIMEKSQLLGISIDQQTKNSINDLLYKDDVSLDKLKERLADKNRQITPRYFLNFVNRLMQGRDEDGSKKLFSDIFDLIKKNPSIFNDDFMEEFFDGDSRKKAHFTHIIIAQDDPELLKQLFNINMDKDNLLSLAVHIKSTNIIEFLLRRNDIKIDRELFKFIIGIEDSEYKKKLSDIIGDQKLLDLASEYSIILKINMQDEQDEIITSPSQEPLITTTPDSQQSSAQSSQATTPQDRQSSVQSSTAGKIKQINNKVKEVSTSSNILSASAFTGILYAPRMIKHALNTSPNTLTKGMYDICDGVARSFVPVTKHINKALYIPAVTPVQKSLNSFAFMAKKAVPLMVISACVMGICVFAKNMHKGKTLGDSAKAAGMEIGKIGAESAAGTVAGGAATAIAAGVGATGLLMLALPAIASFAAMYLAGKAFDSAISK